MNERNAEADLAVCEAATPGPWVVPGYDQAEIAHRHLALGTYPLCNFDLNISVNSTRQVTPYTMGDVPDCNFIALARTALPYWIARAKRMEEALRDIAIDCERCSRDTSEEGRVGESRAYKALANIARQALSPSHEDEGMSQ